MAHLSLEQQKEYRNNGLLVIRDAIPLGVIKDFIDVLKAVVDSETREMYSNKKISDLYLTEPFSTRWYKAWNEHGGEPEYRTWHAPIFGKPLYDLMTHQAILDVVKSLIGPEIQHNGDWLLRPKLPGKTTQSIPWHQDSAYMVNTENYQWITVWLPFVPVNQENGAMQLIPGPHKLPIQEHKEETETTTTPLKDPSINRKVIMPELEPGDFMIFHNHLFHRSTTGHAPSVRWSMDFRFSPAGTPVDETLWFSEMNHLVASTKNPEKVASWTQIVALWEKSEQKNRIGQRTEITQSSK